MTKIITYHDNKNGVQYGEDHKLTNNWNPDADYADNEYIDVYFRIETPSYYHSGGVGFTNDTDRINFYNEIADIMKSLGWKINRYDDGVVGSEIHKDKQYLHLHPQEITGVVPKKEVKTIAEALQNNKYFSIEWVDLYDEFYDIEDGEYKKYLDSKKNIIINKVLKYSKTTRTKLYYQSYAIARKVSEEVGIKRVCDIKDGFYRHDFYGTKYIGVIINELSDKGYLIKKVKEQLPDIFIDYIRTINKTEQKKLKLFITEDINIA